jgi:nitroreductase
MSTHLTVAEAARKRRAMKSFKPDPIPAEVIEELIDITLTAPSSFNLQPVRIIAVQDEKQKKALAEASWNQPQITEAPVTFVFAVAVRDWEKNLETIVQTAADAGAWPPQAVKYVSESAPKFQKGLREAGLEREYAVKDAMISAATLCLTAESMGLSTCYMNGWLEEGVKKVIGAEGDDNIAVAVLLPVGYPNVTRKKPGRLPREKTVFQDRL